MNYPADPIGAAMSNLWKHTGILASLLLLSVMCSVPVRASGDVLLLSVSDEMATPEAKSMLDGSVKFYFGSAEHPAIAHKFGEFVTNEKSNAFARSDARACRRAFLSALLKFQRRAEKLGANAVVHIDSYFKRADASSESQVECHGGFLMAGVALKGDFVKLAEH